MQVKVPAAYSINEKSSFGILTQLREPAKTLELNPVRFILGKSAGYIFTNDDGEEVLYLFNAKPKEPNFTPQSPVLILKNSLIEGAEVDLSDGSWWSPGVTQISFHVKAAQKARASWKHAFNFTLEDQEHSVIGLRKPQLGALHAIHAHWSTGSETATIVMPTGTGKTETMLSVLISCQCDRVLVVVPSVALRTQIADKFETLGILKEPGNKILSETAQRPVVGQLTSGPKTSSCIFWPNWTAILAETGHGFWLKLDSFFNRPRGCSH